MTDKQKFLFAGIVDDCREYLANEKGQQERTDYADFIEDIWMRVGIAAEVITYYCQNCNLHGDEDTFASSEVDYMVCPECGTSTQIFHVDGPNDVVKQCCMVATCDKCEEQIKLIDGKWQGGTAKCKHKPAEGTVAHGTV